LPQPAGLDQQIGYPIGFRVTLLLVGKCFARRVAYVQPRKIEHPQRPHRHTPGFHRLVDLLW